MSDTVLTQRMFGRSVDFHLFLYSSYLYQEQAYQFRFKICNLFLGTTENTSIYFSIIWHRL